VFEQRRVRRLAGLLLAVCAGACGAGANRGAATTPTAATEATPPAPGSDAAAAEATPPAPGAAGPATGAGTTEGASGAPSTGNGGAEPPGPADAAASAREDERLIASVRKAAADKVAPEAMEAAVGIKPVVSTHNGPSLALLRRVKLVIDDAHAEEKLDLTAARTVTYWRRPVDSEDSHFVGIEIRKDGSYAVFFAVLLPP
jgi:hypothetical protein